MSNSESTEHYLQSCQTEFWKDVFEAETEYLLKHLAGCKDVLSVGCGPATIESTLVERGFHVTGIDVSQETLDRSPDNIKTMATSAEDMPFPASCFDAVIYVASLQFIEDYRKAIKKTAHVLRPQGRLIVMLLNPESVFFKRKYRDPNSYVRKIRHTGLNEIENAIVEDFSVQTEFFLGIREDAIFESRDVVDSALYIIRGTRKFLEKGKKA